MSTTVTDNCSPSLRSAWEAFQEAQLRWQERAPSAKNPRGKSQPYSVQLYLNAMSWLTPSDADGENGEFFRTCTMFALFSGIGELSDLNATASENSEQSSVSSVFCNIGRSLFMDAKARHNYDRYWKGLSLVHSVVEKCSSGGHVRLFAIGLYLKDYQQVLRDALDWLRLWGYRDCCSEFGYLATVGEWHDRHRIAAVIAPATGA